MTWRIELLPVPPLSHALVVEVWLTHCMSWVTVNFSPLTVCVVTVSPGIICVVNRDGSAAGPRIFSIAADAICAAITRSRVSSGHARAFLEQSGRGQEREEQERRRDDDLHNGEPRVRVEPVPPQAARNPGSARAVRVRAGRCME